MSDKLAAIPDNEGNSRLASLLELYSISDDDSRLIHSFGSIIMPKMDEFVGMFYDWLRKQPEFEEFFPDEETLNYVQKMSRGYWEEFFRHELNEDYLKKRYKIGETHARIGLPLAIYFAAMHRSLMIFTEDLYDDSLPLEEYLAAVRSVSKLIHMDTSLVVETYSRITNEAMAVQSRSLMEMSTPVTQIWEGVLFLPIVGIVDSKRAQEIMNATLTKISHTQSRAFIMDISGVAVVDTAVANYLIKVTKATRLMGCECTISGLSPAIAQTIVELGIDVGRVMTTATMQDALVDAFQRLGLNFGGNL
ncbi:MAG: protoglobin domain-containing protein [Deltaproteobacteria bacterium]|nr:protoglobin domain-containing protein [Deltaproteobacteria bacterium]